MNIYLSLLLSTLLCSPLLAQLSGGSSLRVPDSLNREAKAAADRGIDWLKQNQSEDGSFSDKKFPALTALPLWAMALAGQADTPAAKKAAAYIASCAKPDGSIYVEPDEVRKGGGLVNYNTAICMTALHLAGNVEHRDLVLKARTFVSKSQHLGGDIYNGGFGYDAKTQRAYTDLLNTTTTVEAMRLTESAEDFRQAGEPKADIDWKKLEAFVQRVQNDDRFNDRPWVSDDPKEKGGFAYHPDQTRAGTHEGKDGSVRFRSMPGMSYAGILSYIYADVDKDDPRVRAAIQWVSNNWDLEVASRDPESAGKDAANEGLYYLYNIMAKGLSAHGDSVLQADGGKAFNWRTRVLKKLISLQKIEPKGGGGYWDNPVSRYWEGDKVLVTAYTLIALNNAMEE